MMFMEDVQIVQNRLNQFDLFHVQQTADSYATSEMVFAVIVANELEKKRKAERKMRYLK